jgi:hypothetical protein
VVEGLSSKCEALSSNPSAEKKEKAEEERIIIMKNFRMAAAEH